MSCEITLEELHERAWSINPKRVSDLEDLWENYDLSNRDFVRGL